MKGVRNRWLPLLRALSLLGMGGIWAVACGGPQEPGAAGSVCFRTDDCKDGLACVPTSKGSTRSVCGNDLSRIVSMVDGAPAEAAAPQGGAGGVAGAGASAGAAGKAGAAAGGTGGKPATGGASGAAGSSGAGGGVATGGAPAGGAPAGGAPSGGSGTAGSSTGGTGTAGSNASGGTGGSEPVDAGNG